MSESESVIEIDQTRCGRERNREKEMLIRNRVVDTGERWACVYESTFDIHIIKV